ncbi:hypothetical protein EJ05DRAFT_505033 [Pseudovirgaria hyperparasitica]|uniref:ABC transporter domain-containing protein n=1 Tax=Pseudovirgaria hyperparasitica TaxID=470096 RepID=A0A6A6VS29_9PEZI|nr:uncharacterized protein EJ05DRAFT_505033 [Pseudovirgaria hyperparasitica]KAF2753392.1 hypothetical protein EJ05DRAFT_505033 [Pseudovirgaria hyperparasitica]
MPSYVAPLRRVSAYNNFPDYDNADLRRLQYDNQLHVQINDQVEEAAAELYRSVTDRSSKSQGIDPAFTDFEAYVKSNHRPPPLSVCFKSLTTYGRARGPVKAKTLKEALWRTFTLRDIYEGSIQPLLFPTSIEDGQALIRDFTGIVRNGEMMLVLGNPGSGCSTFLRTIANDHASFLGVRGHLDYSGMAPSNVMKHFRGSVAYIPEDDTHLPTLTVRQTLDFALMNKTPRKLLHEVPRFLEEFGRIFGMSHAMDTLVGDDFIRGISGGERKRVSILESMASGSSVNAWDGTTRGLDSSSALDYMRSLRIMTDTCERAMVVSIYQASDAMYDLVDKVMLIEDGRMLYQGPARDAESYFNSLGYERQQRQTMSSFLTSVATSSRDNIRSGCESCAVRGSKNLEYAFRQSQTFKDIETEIRLYEAEQLSGTDRLRPASERSASESITNGSIIQQRAQERKSRFVSSGSSYNTSFARQVQLCLQRQIWQMKGQMATFITRFTCIFVSAFLIGSMFYKMPNDTAGVYSRGGFSFYSAVLVAWFQLAELESAFSDRFVVNRQRRFAMVRPGAVVMAKTIMDIPVTVFLSTLYSLVAYFLGGMKRESGNFFTFDLAVVLSAMAFTASYRLFAAASPRLEIALRYSGLYLLVSMIFGGYVRGVDQLISDVPWVGWLAYLTPALYAFEIIMAMEFHGRQFPCEQGSVIPSGPGYDNVAYQSCAYEGIGTGQLTLNGDEYLKGTFGFYYSNVGRNFGILILFLIGCVTINILLAEKVLWASAGSSLEFSHKPCDRQKTVLKDEESDGDCSEKTVPLELPNETTPHQISQGTISAPKTAFSWRNLNYTVQHAGSSKQLLDDVSGFCEPGSLTALVGVSGAGKSTLMNVLTQQAPGHVTGAIKIGSQDVNTSIVRDLGFCQQADIHVETATIREAFEFSAILRQNADVSKADKLVYVDQVLEILGLAELQHALIQSVSLEQRKRTTIGVELCSKPAIALFLDEPTSGLDSQGALNIVKLLRRLAEAGQTIICTIHQADQQQFELFDRVLALARGGRPYYFGDIGSHGRTVIEYFSAHGIVCEPGKNVADFLIEVASGKTTKELDLSKVWSESAEAEAVLRKVDELTTSGASDGTEASSKETRRRTQVTYASSMARQIVELTKRTMTQYWRTPDYIYSRLYCSFFHSVLNGLAFLQLNNSVASIQYRIFSCFLVLMIVPEFINASSMMFVENRNIWLGREYPSRIYGWVAFTSAQIISEIPWAFAGGLIFYVLFYFLVGLPLGTPAGYTFLMMMMFHLFSTSWGQWIAALSADAVMAANIMPFIIIVGEFFNGVLQPQSLMPAVWAYTLYYVGPFMYWISGVVAMILGDLTIHCMDSELIRFQAPPGDTCATYAQAWLDGTTGYLVNPNATQDCGYCQYSKGEDYLVTRQISVSNAWRNLGIFALFCVSNYLSVYLWVYVKSVKNWLPW